MALTSQLKKFDIVITLGAGLVGRAMVDFRGQNCLGDSAEKP